MAGWVRRHQTVDDRNVAFHDIQSTGSFFGNLQKQTQEYSLSGTGIDFDIGIFLQLLLADPKT
jgi:hypothetical protein